MKKIFWRQSDEDELKDLRTQLAEVKEINRNLATERNRMRQDRDRTHGNLTAANREIGNWKQYRSNLLWYIHDLGATEIRHGIKAELTERIENP